MAYYIFIDETGDHSLKSINDNYPLILISGTIFHSSLYNDFDNCFKGLKIKYWDNEDIILHSHSIRKHKGPFNIFFDKELFANFISDLNEIVVSNHYTIIGSYINKLNHIEKYKLKAYNAYHLALGFLLERVIYFLDQNCLGKREIVFLIIESRSKTDNNNLEKYCKGIITNGTAFLSPDCFAKYRFEIEFRYKYQNINGLQLSDLVAYPIAQKVFRPESPNPAYDIIEKKIYQKNGSLYGLKVFP